MYFCYVLQFIFFPLLFLNHGGNFQTEVGCSLLLEFLGIKKSLCLYIFKNIVSLTLYIRKVKVSSYLPYNLDRRLFK